MRRKFPQCAKEFFCGQGLVLFQVFLKRRGYFTQRPKNRGGAAELFNLQRFYIWRIIQDFRLIKVPRPNASTRVSKRVSMEIFWTFGLSPKFNLLISKGVSMGVSKGVSMGVLRTFGPLDLRRTNQPVSKGVLRTTSHPINQPVQYGLLPEIP
jgi:hypothetical protein